MTTVNYPEMWGQTTDEIQAQYSEIVDKFRVTSKNEIKVTRGIKYRGKVPEIGANNTPNKRAGWHTYYMTESAFNKFQQNNDVILNSLLD